MGNTNNLLKNSWMKDGKKVQNYGIKMDKKIRSKKKCKITKPNIYIYIYIYVLKNKISIVTNHIAQPFLARQGTILSNFLSHREKREGKKKAR